jgi:hypothetical protein
VQKGFSYIQALITVSLSLFVLALSLTIFRNTLKFLDQPPRILPAVLDTIGTDISYARTVHALQNTVYITTEDDQYHYSLINHRLAKVRDAIMYLTPATPVITTFTVSTNTVFYELQVATNTEQETRIFRRRN